MALAPFAARQARRSGVLTNGGVNGVPLSSLEQLPKLEDRVHLQGAIKIGSGSLGVVLLVQDRKNPNLKLAIKVISLKLVKDTGNPEARVWREVQVMREIEHPHLVRLVDVLACWNRVPHVQSDPPHVCIAMEYVADSEPLSNALRRQGPSPPLAMQVLPQLAGALARMHQSGLVHRDVWSENVLVSERTGRTVLVDLGCAEYVGSEPAVNSKLNIPYMSPETARGCPQATADDCWALGLLLTEMLTGKFVAERLGRSDWPIHFLPQALADTLREAVQQGGVLLGRICTQLLDSVPGHRLSMTEVLARCQSLPAVNDRPVPPGLPRLATSPMRPSGMQGPPQLPPTAVGVPTPTAQGTAVASPLQSRSYFPPAQVPPVPAPVVGATASHQPPPLDVSFNGVAVQQSNPGAWRQMPAATAFVPQPGPPSSQRCPPPRGHGGASITTPLHMAAATALAAPSMPLCSLSTSPTLPQGTPAAAVAPRAPPTPSGATSSCLQGYGTSQAGTVLGPVTRPAASGPAEVTALQSPKRREITPGLRVAYTARSNGQPYAGTVMGRLGGRGGWHIVLDVGETKDVDDGEVWRLRVLTTL